MNTISVPDKIKRLAKDEDRIKEEKKYYQRIHICLFSDNPDNDAKIIDVTEQKGINIKLVNRYQIGANYLLREHPLYSVLKHKNGIQKLNVLIVGTGNMGLELIKTYPYWTLNGNRYNTLI